MAWTNFSVYAVAILMVWCLGIVLLLPRKNICTILSKLLILSGILILLSFLVHLWIHLQRPPLLTLGETRLWYSFFLSSIGIVTFWRWKYKWFLMYSVAMASLFVLINYLKPSVHDQTLMPALQSIWFVPHVIVYIFAYALLAASSVIAAKALYLNWKKRLEIETVYLADNLVYIGFSFLTMGLIFGAWWAKDAWGHYWTWDAKEIWAFLTWLGYLVYMHYRHFQPKKINTPLWILAFAFVLLLMAWFGINYLPSAQNSVHVYSNN